MFSVLSILKSELWAVSSPAVFSQPQSTCLSLYLSDLNIQQKQLKEGGASFRSWTPWNRRHSGGRAQPMAVGVVSVPMVTDREHSELDRNQDLE